MRVAYILISGFRRDVDEICALLRYYAVSCGNCLPTFRDNVSVPSSWVESPRRKKLGPIRCLKTSVNTTRRHVISQKSADLSLYLVSNSAKSSVLNAEFELAF
jgi:hypothetical protein